MDIRKHVNTDSNMIFLGKNNVTLDCLCQQRLFLKVLSIIYIYLYINYFYGNSAL